MIDVHIYENNGLVAVCDISGGRDEFYEDLARMKKIPPNDREWRPEQNNWKVRNAERYKDLVIEIGDAIVLHKKQLRLKI